MRASQGYVNAHYLKIAAGLFAPIKRRSHALMAIQEGHLILDVGCGPGVDTLALTSRIGALGKVYGIDHDAEMIAIARTRAAEAGLADRVEFQVGDAAALPFARGSLDSCRAERLFMHLTDASSVLAEMSRVVKPGGRIVVTETDWASVSCDSVETEIERTLARFRAEKMLNNGYAGRQLLGQFKVHGLADLTVEIFPLHTTDMELFRFLTLQDQVEQNAIANGAVTRETVDAWRADLERRKRDDRFFGSVNIITVGGRIPI